MLRLANVRKSYPEPGGGRLAILDVPAYKVDAGEQVVLIGRSGCGKTTLLHVIAGISRVDSGEVVIDNVNIASRSEPARDRVRAEKIGYVFQTFNLLAGFSALENVLLGMTFGSKGKDTDRARQLLARVGLEHRLHHKPKALSVGEQQRVAIARALANRPKLLLADEPTANIDPRNQQNIVDLIRETCHEEKVALLLVTHSPEVSAQFSRVDKLEDINRVTSHLAKA
jgi:putative ABC transport system ATP-binding protein